MLTPIKNLFAWIVSTDDVATGKRTDTAFELVVGFGATISLVVAVALFAAAWGGR